MSWNTAFADLGVTVASREQLLASGATSRSLTAAVRERHLLRVRRDHYAPPDTPRAIIHAVRVGGRIGCLSTLAHAGIFAINQTATHVHLERGASRLRHPTMPQRLLVPGRHDPVDLHWSALLDRYDGSDISVGIRDALAQVIRCQESRYAIASLDNALFLGAIDRTALRDIFSYLPAQYSTLALRVDGRAEAGQETVLRLLFEDAGLHCDIQVTFAGIGRVDLVDEGIVIVEADSRLAHDGWELHVRDRNRDIDLAMLGHPSLRPAYQRTMHQPNDVLKAVLGLLAATGRFRVHL